MAELDAKVIGTWHKTGESACAAGYAAHLRFENNGLYFGTTDPPGSFTWWDGGTWKIVAPGQIALSIANDAVVTYRFAAGEDSLSFTDPSGCQFQYRRAP